MAGERKVDAVDAARACTESWAEVHIHTSPTHLCTSLLAPTSLSLRGSAAATHMMLSLVAPLLAWASSTPSMYGVSMKSSLVTIDMTSGKMTELGTEHSCPWSIELA